MAADRNDRGLWALHAGFLAEEVTPVVPAPVLAQAWRGSPRQASLTRFLMLCQTEYLTDELARRVGVLAAASGHRDVSDLAEVEGALRRGDAVVTSDVADIVAIATAVAEPLVVHPV